MPSKANRQVQLPEVPYEVIFADVRFQFSESGRAVFQREIDKVAADESVSSDVRLMKLFLPVTSRLLAARNLPEDFNYLLLYNRYQTSVSNTILFEPGVFWCLTKDQAIDADLQVNEEIDERKHLTRSTEGAAVALLRSNVLYNNWGTTLFAQLASKNVLNAIGVNTGWKGKEFLLIDSPAYGSLIRFLAYKWVMERSIRQYNSERPELVYLYPYGKGKRLGNIAAELRIKESELTEQNRWLATESKIPSDDHLVVLIIPADKKEEIKALSELAANTEMPEKELGFPVVVNDQSADKGRGGSFYRINERRGIRADFCDSPVTLAYKADLSLKTFLEINEIAENEQVNPGQMYYLEEKSGKGPIPYHVARQGENLWMVSMNYGVKMAELLKFNRMEENLPLERGRLVWLQEKRPKNEDVEYREIKAKTYPDSLLDYAVMVSATPFEWIEPKSAADSSNVLPDSTLNNMASDTSLVVSVEAGKSELVSESPKKEIEVRPIEKKPYTEQLRESVNGVSEKKEFVVHEVKKGETLYRISVNYKVPLNQLYELNGLSSNIIEIGDQIKVKRY